MSLKRPLKRPVGPGYNTDPDDVVTTKRRLQDVGLYSPPRGEDVTPFPDRQMYSGLATLQRGIGKRPDGEMRPGDDTDRALTAMAERAGADRGWVAAMPARRTVKPVDGMVREAEVPLLPSNPNDPLSTATPGLGGPGFGVGLGGPGRARGGDIPAAAGGLEHFPITLAHSRLR